MGVLNRGLYGPFLAQLVVVRRCNLSCTYCNEFDEESDPVPTELLKLWPGTGPGSGAVGGFAVSEVAASGGPAERRPRRRPRRRRGLACSPSDTQAIVAAMHYRSRRTHRS